MSLYATCRDNHDHFRITGLYGVPFADDGNAAQLAGQAGNIEPAMLYRNIIEQLDVISYVVEVGGPVSYVSPQVGVFGCTPAGWLGNPGRHADLIHPDDRAEALERIRHSRSTGQPLCHEYRMLVNGGHYAWYRDQLRLSEHGFGAAFSMQGMLTDISRYKQSEQALVQAQQQLRALARVEDQAKERERQRIAQDLHDELGGLLTSIRACLVVSLQRTEQQGGMPDPLLSDACKLSSDAIDAVRQIATELRPSALDMLGVWPAIEWSLAQMEKRTGIDCRLWVDPALPAVLLGAERELALYRIVQEGLTNVVRHAKASRVRVQVQRTAAGLRLAVSDDGVGIHPAPRRDRPSWGIMGMRERAARIGGSLSMAALAGGGTELVLELPLEAAHER